MDDKHIILTGFIHIPTPLNEEEMSWLSSVDTLFIEDVNKTKSTSSQGGGILEKQMISIFNPSKTISLENLEPAETARLCALGGQWARYFPGGPNQLNKTLHHAAKNSDLDAFEEAFLTLYTHPHLRPGLDELYKNRNNIWAAKVNEAAFNKALLSCGVFHLLGPDSLDTHLVELGWTLAIPPDDKTELIY